MRASLMAADTPPAEGEEAAAVEAAPAEEAPDKPAFYKVAEFKAKVLEETGLMADQVQVCGKVVHRLVWKRSIRLCTGLKITGIST